MKIKREQFEDLALNQLDALERIARMMASHAQEAEDLVQETYLRAFRAAESFDLQEMGIRPWLIQIMRNLFRDRIAARGRQPILMDGDSMDALPAGDPGTMPWEGGDLAVEEIRDAMGRLPEEFRTVLMLWAVDEMSYKEIAQAMDLPIGTVMSRLHRARQRLAQSIKSQAPGIKRMETR